MHEVGEGGVQSSVTGVEGRGEGVIDWKESADIQVMIEHKC